MGTVITWYSQHDDKKLDSKTVDVPFTLEVVENGVNTLRFRSASGKGE